MRKTLHPNLHIICGKCGCHNMMSFKINLKGSDNGEALYPAVSVVCDNCSTLTDLTEIIPDETKWNETDLYIKYT